MPTEHWLFLVQRVAPRSGAGICAWWGCPAPPPPRWLAAGRSWAMVLVLFLLGVLEMDVSCRILYSFVGYLYVRGG